MQLQYLHLAKCLDILGNQFQAAFPEFLIGQIYAHHSACFLDGAGWGCLEHGFVLRNEAFAFFQEHVVQAYCKQVAESVWEVIKA